MVPFVVILSIDIEICRDIATIQDQKIFSEQFAMENMENHISVSKSERNSLRILESQMADHYWFAGLVYRLSGS
jgi:hypothetical protein